MIAHTKYRQFVILVERFLTEAMLPTNTPTVTMRQNKGLVSGPYKETPTKIVLVKMFSLRSLPFFE
jgi:hypothetical protein